MNMKRFEVGYEDEMIGVYSAQTQLEAIQLCKEDIASSGFNPTTPVNERVRGMIAVEV